MWDWIFVALIAGIVLALGYRRQARLAAQVRRLQRECDRAQVELEQARSSSARQLGAFLDSLTEGVLLLDSAGRIVSANEALMEMFAFDAPVTGKTLLEVLRVHSLSAAVDEVNRSGHARELEVTLGGGTQRVFQVNASALRRPEGAGVILTFHEITRLKLLEKMRKEFVANVSHELRTPLTLIKGCSETLLEGALNDPAASRRFLGTIQRHADRLALIIEDLLTISHLESGKVLLEKGSLRLHVLVQRLLADLQERAAKRRIRIENAVWDPLESTCRHASLSIL